MSRTFSVNKCDEMRDLAEHLEGHRLSDPHIGPEDCDLIVAALRHAADQNQIPTPAQGTGMQRGQAKDIVWNLITATNDWIKRPDDKYYAQQYEEARDAVIDALVAAQPPASPVHQEDACATAAKEYNAVHFPCSAGNVELLIENLIQSAVEYENNCDRLVAKTIRVELEKAKQAIRDALTLAQPQTVSEARFPHASCKTPSECRKENICMDAWNCSSPLPRPQCPSGSSPAASAPAQRPRE